MQELADTPPIGLFDFDPEPAYNIAPTQKVAAIRATVDAGQNELVPRKWGLISSWSMDPKIASSLINARADHCRKTGFSFCLQAPPVPDPWRRLLRVDRQARQEAAVAIPFARRQTVRVCRSLGMLEAAGRRTGRDLRDRDDGGERVFRQVP